LKKYQKITYNFFHNPAKFTLLFLFILAELFSYALLDRFGPGLLLATAITTLVMVAGIAAVGAERRARQFALISGMLWIAVIWLSAFIDWHSWQWLAQLIAYGGRSIFLFTIIVFMLRHILRSREINLDLIFAAISIYLFIGMAFALLYRINTVLDPDALSVQIHEQANQFATFIYFSFVTLTTLGYGDILPVSHFARTLAFLEAVLGVMYTAVLVASLVSIYVAKTPKNPR
jgi:voltage-gated potassium channel